MNYAEWIPFTVIRLINLDNPRVTTLSMYAGILRISTSPSSWLTLWKWSAFNSVASFSSTNLADISRREPPQVWQTIGVIKIFLKPFSSMYSFNRSSNFIFIRSSPFVLFFFIIMLESKNFCNPVTKCLCGHFVMYIMINKNVK